MKFFFDTSVLVPCFLKDHIHHQESTRALLAVQREEGCCAAHSLAELYAATTRLPGKHRLSGEQALLFLDDVRQRLALVALSADEYWSTLKDAAVAGIVGGAVYDALLCRCAMKVNAELIYTWNVKHFQLLSPEIAERVRTP